MADVPALGGFWAKAVREASGTFSSGALLCSVCFIFAIWVEKVDQAWRHYYQWPIFLGFSAGMLLMVIAAVKTLAKRSD